MILTVNEKKVLAFLFVIGLGLVRLPPPDVIFDAHHKNTIHRKGLLGHEGPPQMVLFLPHQIVSQLQHSQLELFDTLKIQTKTLGLVERQ